MRLIGENRAMSSDLDSVTDAVLVTEYKDYEVYGPEKPKTFTGQNCLVRGNSQA